MAHTKTAAILAAAGSSRRMGGGTPKQYRLCEGLPVVVRAAKAFCACEGIDEVIVSVPRGDLSFCAELFSRYGVEGCLFVEGGPSRMESVWRALSRLAPDTDYVLVHDAARPFVSEALIGRVLAALQTSEAVVPCVAPKNTIRTAEQTLDRSALFEVQTPQGFRYETLLAAYRAARADGFQGTDEAGLTERLGVPTALVEGEERNIKITTARDLPPVLRSGMGYDVHRLIEGRPLMLGCIEVPFEKGLLGHSDADVLAHAIADALLGAAALGDIGKRFPENDPALEGLPGKALLSKTAQALRAGGFTILNIDATLVAERPKIASLTGRMREAVARALGIETGAVSIKATTEEGLGFTGRGEAMAAFAVANVLQEAR